MPGKDGEEEEQILKATTSHTHVRAWDEDGTLMVDGRPVERPSFPDNDTNALSENIPDTRELAKRARKVDKALRESVLDSDEAKALLANDESRAPVRGEKKSYADRKAPRPHYDRSRKRIRHQIAGMEDVSFAGKENGRPNEGHELD